MCDGGGPVLSGRVRLGDWTCPSGNNVVAYHRMIGDGLAVLDLEWDSPPPLLDADFGYYVAVIRPAIVARAQEFTETLGASLLVVL
jgi:hypothetical protein